MTNKSPIIQALYAIAEKKEIPIEMVVETLQSALAAAYRKDFAEPNQNIRVEFDLNTGTWTVYDVKQVVEDVDLEEIEKLPPKERKQIYSPKMHIMLSEAKKIKKDAEIGDIIKTKLEVPEEYGRMAAQTAKQVIIQKLKEAERNTIYQDLKDKENSLIIGTIQRIEGKNVLVDLGKTIGLLPPDQQIPTEKYRPGDKIKVYINSVEMGNRGPEIILSRTHPDLVKLLFEQEIPEINNGIIKIHAIAREPGYRSKVAVEALEENIDPIGSCVGQRGARVQTIINELNGEKIDIIEYSENPNIYISNALSPAKILEIKLNKEKKEAYILVTKDQVSLAIGKSGQNVRLAAKLTGWKINIKSETGETVGSSDSENFSQDYTQNTENQEEKNNSEKQNNE